MRECKMCPCEIRENIRKHAKSRAHKKFLENAFINKYVEKDINADKIKDIINKRNKDLVEKFTNFTIMFCWKVNNIEYSITIVKEEVLGSGSNSESLDTIIKRVFNQIYIDNFEDFTFFCFRYKKPNIYIFHMNQPMEMIQRKKLTRFF